MNANNRRWKVVVSVFTLAFVFALSPFTFRLSTLRTLSAWAAAYNFYATTDVSAGDVVVWDSTTAYGVKTTNVEGANTVAGVAAKTVSAGSDCTIRQDGGRATVNVTGAITKGQWLITSTTLGKAKGVDSLQAGIFARAITDAGTPAAGQVYASVDMGYLGYITGAEGQANTASNLGAGIGVFEQKSGADLQFNSFVAGSNKVFISEDDPNDEIDVDVNEGNIAHQNLSGAGTNTHAQIDTHIADADKHREINDSGTGSTDLWSADKINTELASAGTPLTVEEEDGSPTDSAVTTIKVPNNTLDNPSAGTVSFNPTDISERVYYYDDFLGDNFANLWATDVAGTGAAVGRETDTPNGVATVKCGTANAASATLYLGDGSFSFVGSKNTTFEAYIKGDTLSSDDNYFFGFVQLSPDYDWAVFKAKGDTDSGEWYCETRNSSPETTNTDYTTNTWRHFKIVVSASDVKFYIDGSLVATHSSQVPDDRMDVYFTGEQQSGPGTNRTLYVDAVLITQDR